MKLETERFLDKAQLCLRHAGMNLRIQLGNDAGRNAYLAAFHAAQAFIYERSGRAAKTHRGVHTQFDKLAAAEPAIDSNLRRFLGRAYSLKAVADYETGPGSDIPLDRATTPVETAKAFVDRIAGLLGNQLP